MRQRFPSVRIFCVDHREQGETPPPGVTPIAVGKNRREGFLRDSEGKNIAHLNPHLNETTAIWWVWQHPEVRQADYVGFCHYRRFLLFRPLRDRKGTFSSALCGILLKPSRYPLLRRLPCGESDAARILSKSAGVGGFLLLSGWTSEPGGLAGTMRAHGTASARWIERALDLVAERLPECRDYYRAVFRRPRSYAFNTFVVRRELFEEMCERLLPVLLRLTEEWQADPAPKVSLREPGFIAEQLIGTYWRWLEERGERFRHCHYVAFLKNGHGGWYLPFARLAYRLFPDRLL